MGLGTPSSAEPHTIFCACSEFLRDGVKPPLCIGDVLLEDGTTAKGFLGEAYAVKNVPDVSQFGGWRQYAAAGGDASNPVKAPLPMPSQTLLAAAAAALAAGAAVYLLKE